MKSVTASVAHAVGEVAERAAGEQADRQPQPRSRRVEREPDQDEDQGDDRHREHRLAPAAEDPERDAAVGDAHEVEAEDQVAPARPGASDGDHDRLRDLVERPRPPRRRRVPVPTRRAAGR